VRVFVVDNDATWTDLVALDLRLEGHDVVATADAAEPALEQLAAIDADVDVVVTDYRMPPGPNGLELVAALQQAHPDIHAVVFTNYVDHGLAERAEALGARFVAKPDLRALRAAVSLGRPTAT
jgi:CheY-like chemotaxis protein